MNSKKAKKLRKLVFSRASNKAVYAHTNKKKRQHSLSDLVQFEKAGKEVQEHFFTSTRVSVKLKAQYKRLKKRIAAQDKTQLTQLTLIKKLSQPSSGKLRSKTQKNQDKRARKQLRALIN